MIATIVIMSIILWLALGTWILYKYNWYNNWEDEASIGGASIFTILFSGIVFIISFIGVYVCKPWDFYERQLKRKEVFKRKHFEKIAEDKGYISLQDLDEYARKEGYIKKDELHKYIE